MTLLALQRDFRAFLTDAPNGVECWTTHNAPAGLAVYHNAYRVQLLDCLRATFEKLHAWLGEDAFVAAARTHIESTPPSGWTLSAYGENFDITLAKLYPEDPEVAELAWLEWALSQAFEAADAAPLNPDDLATIDWDAAVITFAPSLQIGRSMTNACAIWSALAAGEDPPAAISLPAPAATLVWRQDLTPCFRSIEAVEQHALTMIGQGKTFGELCAELVREHGDQTGVEVAGQLLGTWLREDMVVAIIHNDGRNGSSQSCE